jgi:hypothetical protein
MTNYQNDIMNLLQGDTPKQKYDNLKDMQNLLTMLVYPRRGTSEETMSLHEFVLKAEHLIKKPE